LGIRLHAEVGIGFGEKGKAAHKNPFPNKDESLSPKSAKVTFARGLLDKTYYLLPKTKKPTGNRFYCIHPADYGV
jgi:hypothetical protein